MPISPARDVGVQSWSLRHFKDLSALIAQYKTLGATAIEICGVHVNFDDPANHAAVIAPLKAAGIRIRSMGVQTFTGDEAAERNWFAFAKAAGVETITAHFRVDSFTKAVPIAARLAAEHGVKLGIHCHGGYMFGGSTDIIDHLMALGGDRIGICIDTAWCMQAAGDPVAWAKKYAGRVYGVHYKDFTFKNDGKWSEVITGRGALKLAELVHTLEETGFAGTAVVEYEANEQNPVGDIAECLKAIAAVPARALAR